MLFNTFGNPSHKTLMLVHGLGVSSGRVGHRTTEYAHHIDKIGACDEVDDIGRAAGQQHGAHGQHVERDASLAERREETRSHLQTDGVDEEDEAKLLDEVSRCRIEQETKVSRHDTHEEYPRHTQRHAAKLNPIESEADGDDQSHDEHRVGHATTGEEVYQPFHDDVFLYLNDYL